MSHEIDERVIEIHEEIEGLSERLFQVREIASETGRFAVGMTETGEVFGCPVRGVVDPGQVEGLMVQTFLNDRHRQPDRVAGAENPVAVAPASAVVLDIIEIDEQVGLEHLVEETEPGDVAGLEDDTFHTITFSRRSCPAGNPSHAANRFVVRSGRSLRVIGIGRGWCKLEQKASYPGSA